MEAQTAEEAKRLSKAELCVQKPVIDLQMPASRNLAVNRNINQFQRLMRGHSAAKMRHTYTLFWRSTATFILRRVCYVRLLPSTVLTVHCSVQGTGTSRSRPGFEHVFADQR